MDCDKVGHQLHLVWCTENCAARQVTNIRTICEGSIRTLQGDEIMNRRKRKIGIAYLNTYDARCGYEESDLRYVRTPYMHSDGILTK